MNVTFRPINGGSKSERIYFEAIPNEMNWAYFKMMRENDKTKVIFEDINPYVEVYKSRENVYSIYCPNCDGGGDEWMYLVVGPEKAMLIDTGYGLGGIKTLCERLAGGKEVIVANTHMGPDHCLGNLCFDTVYCHEYEVENIKSRCAEGCFDYLFDENGNNIWLKFDKEDLPEWKDYELIGVPDGYTWDLGGGYEIELIWTAGHMPGHAVFLDKSNRILFAGDAVCADVIGIGTPSPGIKHGEEYRNIKSYRDRLEGIVARIDEIDWIFPGHYIIDIESRVLYDILDALNDIVANPAGYDYKKDVVEGHGRTETKLFKHVQGFGVVGYEPGNIYPVGEEPEEFKEILKRL